jgi:hypothetical protein
MLSEGAVGGDKRTIVFEAQPGLIISNRFRLKPTPVHGIGRSGGTIRAKIAR